MRPSACFSAKLPKGMSLSSLTGRSPYSDNFRTAMSTWSRVSSMRICDRYCSKPRPEKPRRGGPGAPVGVNGLTGYALRLQCGLLRRGVGPTPIVPKTIRHADKRCDPGNHREHHEG